ncbi:Down syndrome cell adhesion molecule-like protein, partial [Dinothrombium tinctorium]
GNYTCSVKNDVGSDSVTVLLTVKMAPKWIKEPKDITVTMGESVSIECDAIASPKPTIYWRHLNTNENTKSKVLKINAVKESNSGKYECVVSNKHGDLLKKTISVTVSGKRAFKHISEKYALIHAKSGESAKLSCNAIGDKPLAVTWIKESKLDKRGGENYEIFDHVTEHGLNSELVIRSVKREDEYLYKCLAENEYGSDEKTVKLVVIEVPGAPTNVRVNERWSRSATVAWNPPFNGNSPITKYTIQYWIHQSPTRKLNEVSVDGTLTNTLIKDLKPEPSLAPIDITAESRGSSTIRVTWRAPPNDHWNGELQGFYVGYKVRDSQQQFSFRTVPIAANADISHKYEHFIRNLLKGTVYDVVVKAFNAAGSGPQSHPVRVQTLDGDLPESPFLSVTSSTRTSLSLRWLNTESTGKQLNIISYTLYYQKENDDWRQIPIPLAVGSTALPSSNLGKASESSYSYVLNNLESGTRYNIYVTAANNYGIGDPSNIVKTRTNGGNHRNFLTLFKFIMPFFNFLDPFVYSATIENVNEIPYYFQPLFVIPIITAIVIVVVVLVITYVYLQRIKSRYSAPDGFNTLTSKHLTFNGTTHRFSAGFDNTSKPLMSDQINVFPSPYATMPMGAKHNEDPFIQKQWERQLPNPKITNTQPQNSHIYDNPQ